MSRVPSKRNATGVSGTRNKPHPRIPLTTFHTTTRLRIKTSDGNSQSAACKWYASDGRRTITFDRPGSKGTTFDDESGCTAAVEHFLNDSRPLVAESVWKTLVFWIQSDEPKPVRGMPVLPPL